MKRLLTLLVLCCSVLLAFPKFIGDVNGDGVINVADVTALVNIITGKTSQYDSRLADVDENGTVDKNDVAALVDIILGNRQAKPLPSDGPDTLFINYSDAGATYELPEAWTPYVTVTVSGTDVTVDNTNEAEEYVTALSGSCSDGSFVYNGTFKTTIVLKGLSLTNQRGTCIDIEDNKRVNLQLADGTENVLADGTTGKAALFCKGHLEVSKGGTLSVQGNVKHAISTKEYMEVKKTVGTITVTG